MQAQLAAVREVTAFFVANEIKHFVIGGIANAVWGEPRATQDADFKIIVGDRAISDIVALVAQQFRFRVPNPEAFARQTYVLPVRASNDIGVDIGLGFLPYEELAIDRAVAIELSGVSFAVCTAEDLIIQKAISEREKDWSDIEGVLTRQGPALDQDYILHWLPEFAAALERPELVQRYLDLRRPS